MNHEQQEIAYGIQLAAECQEYICLCDELEKLWGELVERLDKERFSTPIENWERITPDPDAARQRAVAVASLRVRFIQKFKAAAELVIEPSGGNA